MSQRTCSRCGLTLPPAAFHESATDPVCRSCVAKANRSWHAAWKASRARTARLATKIKETKSK